jgi:DNA ligase (NAD+)
MLKLTFLGTGTSQGVPVISCECEVCHSSLVDSGSRLYCANKNCPKRVLHQLLKFQQVVDIRDLGETLITELFNSKKVQSIKDFYALSVEDLVPFFLNQESIENEKQSLGAEKVYKSIRAHKNMSLPTFIGAFDIEGIGETTIEKLVEAGYNSLEKLFEATVDQIASVYGFAEITAKTLIEGL